MMVKYLIILQCMRVKSKLCDFLGTQMSPNFQVYLEKQYMSTKSRKSKKTNIKTLRKILSGIVLIKIDK